MSTIDDTDGSTKDDIKKQHERENDASSVESGSNDAERSTKETDGEVPTANLE